jgi:hypothetical protein
MSVNDRVDATRSSIVAFYDALPPALAALVTHLQLLAGGGLGSAFMPRPLEQVHATVIGLETASGRDGSDRARFDARPLAAHLLRSFTDRPLDIQFGGFGAADRRLLSRGACPHDRTFLVGPSDVVLIGWPVDVASNPALPLAALADLRRSCEPLGARHRYHVEPGSSDPDAYLVIGLVTDPDERRNDALGALVRRELATRAVRVPMRPHDLSLVEYADTALPVASTRRLPLVGLESH